MYRINKELNVCCVLKGKKKLDWKEYILLMIVIFR